MRTIIATLFNDDSSFPCHFPQAGGVSTSPKVKAIYLRCMCASLRTSVKFNPEAEHIFFTNRSDLPKVDGFDLEAFLKRIGVRLVTLPFEFKPPPGYFHMWNNTWFLFDIVEWLAAEMADEDVCLVNDCDVIYLRDVSDIVSQTRKYGCLTYDLGYPLDHAENGMNGHEATALYKDLGVPLGPEDSWYYGSDFYIATGRETKRIAGEARTYFDDSMQRHAEGRPKLTEEAYLVSLFWNKFGYEKGTANPFMRRMWTDRSFRDVEPADFDRHIWHLPAEKKTGFRVLFNAAMKDSKLWDLPQDQFRLKMSQVFGIPNQSKVKQVRDFMMRGAAKLAR